MRVKDFARLVGSGKKRMGGKVKVAECRKGRGTNLEDILGIWMLVRTREAHGMSFLA